MVGYLVEGNAMRDFGIQVCGRGDDGDFCVGVEDVEDTACCYLCISSSAILCMISAGPINQLRWRVRQLKDSPRLLQLLKHVCYVFAMLVLKNLLLGLQETFLLP